MPVVPQLIRFAGSRNSLTDSVYRILPIMTISRESIFFRFFIGSPCFIKNRLPEQPAGMI